VDKLDIELDRALAGRKDDDGKLYRCLFVDHTSHRLFVGQGLGGSGTRMKNHADARYGHASATSVLREVGEKKTSRMI
jgi:hypothetical protein